MEGRKEKRRKLRYNAHRIKSLSQTIEYGKIGVARENTPDFPGHIAIKLEIEVVAVKSEH